MTMNKPKIKCLSCKYAHWHKTESGRLSPTGAGSCTWEPPQSKTPASMYYLSPNAHKPHGGYITRKPGTRRQDIIECPTLEPIQP